MLLLMYALTTAYIGGAGVLISDSLSSWWGFKISTDTAIIAFTIIGGAVVCIGTHSVDFINRILFTAKTIFSHHVSCNDATRGSRKLKHHANEKGLILAAVPVIFTSFWFPWQRPKFS